MFFRPVRTAPALRRSYYSANKPTQPIEARVIERRGDVALQVYRPSLALLLPPEKNASGLLPDPKGDDWMTLFDLVPSYSITETGHRYYHPHHHPYTYYTDFLRTTSHSKGETPQMLYAIPQVTWNEFVSRITNQEVAKLLNLNEHRHLYREFNFAMQGATPQIKRNRAEALGNYHFLWYFEDDNVLELNAKALQKKASDAIDAGRSIPAVLTGYPHRPYLTPAFLEKVAHCYRMSEIDNLGQLLVDKATSYSWSSWGEIDKRKLDEFVAALPSSKTHPKQFYEMIHCMFKLKNVNCDNRYFRQKERILSRLFYQARNDFNTFKTDFNWQLINDYLDALVRDLVFPESVRVYYSIPKDQRRKHYLINENDWYYNCKEKLINYFNTTLLEEIKVQKLNALQARWHRNVNVIAANKPRIKAIKMEWHPLFAPQQIQQVTFTCLTSDEHTMQEGKEMSHCVAGYNGSCLSGGKHLVSAKATSGARSTLDIEMQTVAGKSCYVLLQNASVRNARASDEILGATQELMERLNKGVIAVSTQTGVIEKEAYMKLNHIAQYDYPYDLTDEAVQEQIYQAYKETVTLPSIMVAASYREMVVKLGLDQFLMELFIKRPSPDEMKSDFISATVSNNRI